MIKNSLLALGFILLAFGNPFGVLLLVPAAVVHLINEMEATDDEGNLIINPYI